MPSNTTNIHKLQSAINRKGRKILYGTTQFYSQDQDRPVTIYQLKEAVWDEKKHKNINASLYQSTSQIQILLYLRDMWYEINGWEVPTDNKMWEDLKAKRNKKEGEYDGRETETEEEGE